MSSGSGGATLEGSQVDYAQRLRTLLRERQRREIIWAWLSFAALILCWDASSRLDERVSAPRVRIAHAVDAEPPSLPAVKRR